MAKFIYFSVFSLVVCINVIRSQITTIPDSNFEQSLIDQGIDSDGIINGKVLTSDVASLSTLDVSGYEISQLTGIQDFLNLTELYCQNNSLSSLTLSTNAKIQVLDCSQNELSTLYLKDLVELRTLKCSFNQINELNLTDNVLLEEFYCDHNLLKTLNLKSNVDLTALNCANNLFSVLNITFNWQLVYLNFSSNLLSYVDLSNNVKVEHLNSSKNPLESIFLNNMTQLKSVYMVDNDLLRDVNFSHNHQLEEIICRDNDLLSNINLSAALALKYLDCRNNSLTQLQTLYNPLLESLFCQNNQIKELDLSQNMNLAFLKCNDNQLEALDLKNGSNNLMKGGMTYYDGQYIYLDGMDARNNPALICIQVDDEQSANSGVSPYDTWLKDETTSYSENCEANLGIEQQELSQQIQVYPNPVEVAVTIENNSWVIERVILYSIQGKKIKQFDFPFESISLNGISSGFYFLIIHTEKGVAVKRILKR